MTLRRVREGGVLRNAAVIDELRRAHVRFAPDLLDSRCRRDQALHYRPGLIYLRGRGHSLDGLIFMSVPLGSRG